MFLDLLSGLASGLIDLPWWGYIVVALILTHITIASVTIFLHRHQAHRALDLHPIPSHFFRFWLWMTTGMVTKEWAAIHRKHHAKCETVEDPHSPQTRGLSKVMWEGAELYRTESRNQETMNKYGQGTPDDWIERNIYTKHSALGVSLMLIINVALFGGLGATIWAVQMLWIPIWAAGVVNGVGHYWGYRNYDCADASTNIFPWGILIGGEELHNNHHTYATSAKLSAKWYEFDIGWMYIRILEILGLAKVKKVLPKPKFADAKPVVDFDMLQAVITHRYDVMRRYIASAKAAYHEELEKVHSSLDKHQLSALKRWFSRDAASVPDQDKAYLETALAKSQRLETLYSMRRELSMVWERSTASREQLVKQLQDWCHRAEESGIAQLQEFSLRLRRYAV